MTHVGSTSVSPVVVAGRYQLGATVGRGGMADVHAGQDLRLGREVAVKVMRADLARDPVFRARFEREAQNVAAMNHPGIVAVYDTGELAAPDGTGLPYIVMEYVSGSTLRDLVRAHGPMAPDRAASIIAEVCAALEYSHQHGLVHRDVKPANVMITPDGVVKVMDFGIARAISQTRTGLTGNDTVIGTAQYLAPEQGLGKDVDARADVYATGCVLFELLTGSPPFTGDSPLSIVYQHVREDPPLPSERLPSVPGRLDSVALAALAKNPDNRYGSAEEMRADLERVLGGQRPLAPAVMGDSEATTAEVAGLGDGTGSWAPSWDDDGPSTGPLPATGAHAAPRRRRGRRVALAAAALALLVLLGGGAWWIGPGSYTAVPELVGVAEPEARTLASDAGFTPLVEPVPSASEQTGQVVSSLPAAGESLRQGEPLTLRVGRGPALAEVPDLTGQDPEQARQAVTAAGLVLTPVPQTREVDDAAQVGQVVGQDPAAGALLPPGTPLTLVIGEARATLQVPDVTGRDRATAVSTLEGVGLRVDAREVDASAPAGTVVATAPGGGTEVATGSAVTIDVSRGAPAPPPSTSPAPETTTSAPTDDEDDDGDGDGDQGPSGLFPGLFGNR